MTRTTFLATLLALLSFTSVAAADSAPPPPSPLVIEGARTSITVSGGPDHATYTLTNHSALPMEVFLERVIWRDGRYNIPLRVRGATAGGRDLGRTFTVPANGSVRAVVSFAAAPSNASEWNLVLRVMVGGRRVEGAAHVGRAHRDPVR